MDTVRKPKSSPIDEEFDKFFGDLSFSSSDEVVDEEHEEWAKAQRERFECLNNIQRDWDELSFKSSSSAAPTEPDSPETESSSSLQVHCPGTSSTKSQALAKDNKTNIEQEGSSRTLPGLPTGTASTPFRHFGRSEIKPPQSAKPNSSDSHKMDSSRTPIKRKAEDDGMELDGNEASSPAAVHPGSGSATKVGDDGMELDGNKASSPAAVHPGSGSATKVGDDEMQLDGDEVSSLAVDKGKGKATATTASKTSEEQVLDGELQVRVVKNDNTRESSLMLVRLVRIICAALVEMAPETVTREVLDPAHTSMVLVRFPSLEVIGGMTYREFPNRGFIELTFVAIADHLRRTAGYGSYLMNHFKDYISSATEMKHVLVYADDTAVKFFRKQAFTEDITLPQHHWSGYIKVYNEAVLMQFTLLPRARYLSQKLMLKKQKEAVQAKINAFPNNQVVHQPPTQWAQGVQPIDPMSIPAIAATGWTPEMDKKEIEHNRHYPAMKFFLKKMSEHPCAKPFTKDAYASHPPLYSTVIKSPMDLLRMEQRMENGIYDDPEMFIADFKLMLINAKNYYPKNSEEDRCTDAMFRLIFRSVHGIPDWDYLLREPYNKRARKLRGEDADDEDEEDGDDGGYGEYGHVDKKRKIMTKEDSDDDFVPDEEEEKFAEMFQHEWDDDMDLYDD